MTIHNLNPVAYRIGMIKKKQTLGFVLKVKSAIFVAFNLSPATRGHLLNVNNICKHLRLKKKKGLHQYEASLIGVLKSRYPNKQTEPAKHGET